MFSLHKEEREESTLPGPLVEESPLKSDIGNSLLAFLLDVNKRHKLPALGETSVPVHTSVMQLSLNLFPEAKPRHADILEVDENSTFRENKCRYLPHYRMPLPNDHSLKFGSAHISEGIN